jgi:hypothetical protein
MSLLELFPSLKAELLKSLASKGGKLVSILGKIGSVYDVADALRNLTDEQIHELGGIEAVKAMVADLYDTYIAPIDIPFINNTLEALVIDPLLRRLLLWSCDEIHDRVHPKSE